VDRCSEQYGDPHDPRSVRKASVVEPTGVALTPDGRELYS